MKFKRKFLFLFSIFTSLFVLPAMSELKQKPQSAEECKEDIRLDVKEIVESQSPKTKLIPKSDWTHIEEQYIEYESQHESGDIKITAMEYLQREMVELYCDGISETPESNEDTEKNDNTDELKKQFKQEVDNVVAAFQTQTKKIKEKQQNSKNKKG